MRNPSPLSSPFAQLRRPLVGGTVLAALVLAGLVGWVFFRPARLSPQLVVVTLDGEPTSWSGARLAELIDALDVAGAQAVALALPSQGAPSEASLESSWENEALAAALSGFGRVVVASSPEKISRPSIEGDASALELSSSPSAASAPDVLRQAAWGEGFAPPLGVAGSPLLTRRGDNLVPSLALAAVAALEEQPVRLDQGGRLLRVGRWQVRLDDRGAVTAPRLDRGEGWVHAEAVLAGRAPELAGRLVWISFAGLGAESTAMSLEREVAVASWLLGGAGEARRRRGAALAAWLGLLLAPFAVGFLTLGKGGAKRQQQEEVRALFAGALPESAVAPWLVRPAEAPLALERRQASVVVAELGGLEELAETLAPDRLAEALGEGLGSLRDRVFEQGGLIERLDPLGARAVFGAPLPLEHPAGSASACALSLRQAFGATRASLAAQYELPLARVALTLEIGLASGALVVGHLPQPGPGVYAALGPPMVQAARLARLCRGFGVAILATQGVAEAAGDEFLFRELDRVRMRGLGQPLTLFELVTSNPAAPADRQRVVRYQTGLAAYRNREFLKAERLFASIVEDLGEDGAARLMAERCRRFRSAPPPEGWDGTSVVS